MTNAESIGLRIYNAANSTGDTSLTEIIERTGITQEELEAGIRFWATADDVRIEPEAHGRRAQEMASVIIGGEARHWIRFA